MQRIPLLSIALLSTVAAGDAALAGPLSLNPQSQRAPIASIYSAPSQTEPPPPVRQVAAQGEYGGGFFEMLFRGPGGSRQDSRYDYRQSPADMGPGMVESPYNPGQPVMDPRFMKQEVAYD